MRCRSLIIILGQHNEEGILAAAKYMPERIIFIYKRNQYTQEQLQKINQCYLKRFSFLKVFNNCIEKIDINSINNILREQKSEETIISLNGADKLTSLIFLNQSKQYNIQCIYINIEKESLLTFKDNNINITKQNFLDLGVKDVIESLGGSIILEGTDLSHCESIQALTKIIANNQEEWQTVKYRISDKEVFIHDESNPTIIKINLRFLPKKEIKTYIKILNILKEFKEIDYEYIGEHIRVRFLTTYIKSFIFKSGSWLEVFTKNIVEEIEKVDDVKNSVLFLWNDYKKRVKNELDVVAIKDSLLICISCKDSAKYDDVALNELNVYANQLGGRKVIKILVATKKPLKGSIIDRAKEMDINLIIYDGNIDRFKKNIEEAIKV
ncbi:Card1-like endonuclease domain-containing protein [Clostridium fallax]|uniref:Card1 endonuclease domain-containing protein n=1 Tax=Clostridium fallax TaxID=1533 RepID=A0A1M4W3D7_9CLOT|nr:DUF1887 family CARF protein [Clostridium fallax]SHE75623.1 protein of unknown function [Clostridium fallax]SQB22854.1 Domain of uncharacterised function (DUF1887) [Clostridium fallax]